VNGSAKYGWVFFLFNPSNYDELRRPGPIFSLELKDSHGQIITVTQTNGVDLIKY